LIEAFGIAPGTPDCGGATKKGNDGVNIKDEEIKSLECAKSAQEWNAACEKIKRDRDGKYPPDWWEKVSRSGLMAQVSASWLK
jgi:hypothetical protein